MGPSTWAPSDTIDTVDSAVFEALGAASVCWESMEGTGVFQSEQAVAIGNGLLEWLAARVNLDGLRG